MASLTLINNNTKLALSSEAHMPHYLGKATYIGTTQVDAPGSMNGLTTGAFVYQISCAMAPLAFVRLASGTGYSVRQVYQYSAGVWRVAVSTTGALTSTPPDVFCFGRINSTKAGGPALRLFDSSGAVAFDSNSNPIRIAGRPEFASVSGSYDPGITEQALPTGMTSPAVCMECFGWKQNWNKSGAFWLVTLYIYHWLLSGANLRRDQYLVGLDGREDGGPTSSVRTVLGYAKPAVIETYGLS